MKQCNIDGFRVQFGHMQCKFETAQTYFTFTATVLYVIIFTSLCVFVFFSLNCFVVYYFTLNVINVVSVCKGPRK